MPDVKSKKISSLLAACLVLVGSAGATSVMVVGCGGDDNSPPDETGDSGTDGTADVVTPDAHADVTVPDGGGDSSPTDAMVDSPVTHDGSSDASEAGDSSEASALTAAEYPSAIDQALCARLAACCELDSGTFDTAGCIAIFGGNPIGVGEATPYLDSGLVTFNATQGQACLNDLANFPCGTVNAAQNVMLGQDCVAAFTGTQTTGGPCADPIECPSTDYCQAPGDGGVGTCTALQHDGGTCTDNTQCSYLGGGIPAQYCNTITGSCLPQLPNGANCTNLDSCQSQICRGSPTKTCISTYVFSDPGAPNGTCASLTILDAGGD